jgi:hypothetical protein
VGARFAEPDIWKSVQQTKAAAALELGSLLSQWREDACKIGADALARLPEDLKQHGLDENLATPLSQPLETFTAALETAIDPARVAALPARARQLVGEIGTAIQKEVDKRKPRADGSRQPHRELRHLRLSDLTTVRLVRTEAEWDALAKKIDRQVRELLRDYEVELE